MAHGVPEAVDDVEADPSAVFDAHGADSIDELLASGPEESDDEAASEDDVAALFSDGLSSPPQDP